jgi:hypothetical protein
VAAQGSLLLGVFWGLVMTGAGVGLITATLLVVRSL